MKSLIIFIIAFLFININVDGQVRPRRHSGNSYQNNYYQTNPHRDHYKKAPNRNVRQRNTVRPIVIVNTIPYYHQQNYPVRNQRNCGPQIKYVVYPNNNYYNYSPGYNNYSPGYYDNYYNTPLQLGIGVSLTGSYYFN